MISLHLQKINDSSSNTTICDFPIPLTTESALQSTTLLSHQSSSIDQTSSSISEQNIHIFSQKIPKDTHNYHEIQTMDSKSEEYYYNKENLSQTTLKIGEKIHQNINLFNTKEKDQLNQNDEEITFDDDSTPLEQPLSLPLEFNQEVENELDFKIQCDQELETQYFEQVALDIKEQNDLYSAVSIQGNRKEMQDKYSVFIELNNLQFYGVFDGHGNDKIATYLRDNLFTFIISHPSFLIDIKDAINQTFLQIDQYFQQNEEFQESGCVCVCALIINGFLYICNLGDCRATIFDNCGNSHNLSLDHTPINRQDEVERILSQHGFFTRKGNQLRVFGELNVTRAFGNKKLKSFIIAEPEIIAYDIYTLLCEFEFREVFLVLASDGFWNDYNNSYSSIICNQGFQQFPNNCLEQIFNQKQCHRDNTTIISINLQKYYFSLFNSEQMNQILEASQTI